MSAGSISYAQHLPKVSVDLEGRDPESSVRVIVQYKRAVQQRHIDAVVRQGGRYQGTLNVVNGAVYSIPAKALSGLADDPEIAYISQNRTVNAADYGAGTLTPDYKLQAVYANYAQMTGLNGAGIGVAVIDSGITDSPDLHGQNGYSQFGYGQYGQNGSRVVYAQSFNSGGQTTDAYGHGTHVAGIVGGNGSQSSGVYAGVATNVNIINLQVLDSNGSSTDSDVIAAIQQAIQLKAQYNIRVINLSLGRPVFESYALDPVCQAVEAAWKAGIVVVVAAGNEGRNNTAYTNGYGTITAPGNDPM